MRIKPIKTEREYRRVMKEIEGLMDAEARTAAGNRLDLLAKLAEQWEEKHVRELNRRVDSLSKSDESVDRL